MDYGLRDQARQVVESARAFSAALDRTAADRTVALDDLAQVARGWAARAEGVQGFAASGETAAAELPPEDRLAVVASDLDVAGVLLAAGIAADEVETGADGRQMLRSSVDRLDEQTTATVAPGGATLGFAAPAQADEPAADPHATFAATLASTVDAVVEGTLAVLQEAWQRLRKLAPDVLPEALAALDAILDAAPQVGRLVRLGLQALKRALLALLDLMPEAAKDRVRACASEWWGQQGDATERKAVAWLVAAQKAKGALQAVDIPSVGADLLGNAEVQLRALGDRFSKLSKAFGRVLAALAAAVAVAALIAAVVTVVAAWVPLAAAAGYSLAAGSVILFARDYLDTGGFPARVNGVQQIIRGLLSE